MKINRKPGRPPKQREEIKNKRITIRFTEEENGKIEDCCKKNNVSRSELIRNAILEKVR
jgi:metal-responsive CopG/Arc/MetJ family transcriptional regulator